MRIHGWLLALMLCSVLLAGPAVALVTVDDEESTADVAELEAELLNTIMATLEVLEAKGDVDGMIELYRKALAIAPDDRLARERMIEHATRLLGYAQTHEAEPAELLALVTELEAYVGDEFPMPTALWYHRAAALQRLGRTDEADALRRNAAACKPGAADTHRRVGEFLLTTALYEEAITEYEIALAAAGDEERSTYTWAIAAAHLMLEHYETAADLYERAVELARKDGRLFDYERLFSGVSYAMYHLGRYYELRGEHEKTIAANERAIAVIIDDSDKAFDEITAQNLTAIGDAYLKLDKPKKALEALERANELVPDSAEIHGSIGDAYAQLGEEDKARKEYEQCETLHRTMIAEYPNHPSAYNNLAWFFVTHDMNLDEALKLARTSVELAPETAEYLDTLAEISHRLGQHDEALNWIQKVFELHPEPRHLVYYEQQRDKFEKAKEGAE
jgi:tetratricopeptide (TPR) repeat protein